MDNFDLRKYLAEGKLFEEESLNEEMYDLIQDIKVTMGSGPFSKDNIEKTMGIRISQYMAGELIRQGIMRRY